MLATRVIDVVQDVLASAPAVRQLADDADAAYLHGKQAASVGLYFAAHDGATGLAATLRGTAAPELAGAASQLDDAGADFFLAALAADDVRMCMLSPVFEAAERTGGLGRASFAEALAGLRTLVDAAP